ncbi:MAG: hypothetical protein FJ318_10115, partial [SAR202 cluster bacterium]|nr:hypothetical protein [SAR202 cluster bacterium]
MHPCHSPPRQAPLGLATPAFSSLHPIGGRAWLVELLALNAAQAMRLQPLGLDPDGSPLYG